MFGCMEFLRGCAMRRWEDVQEAELAAVSWLFLL